MCPYTKKRYSSSVMRCLVSQVLYGLKLSREHRQCSLGVCHLLVCSLPRSLCKCCGLAESSGPSHTATQRHMEGHTFLFSFSSDYSAVDCKIHFQRSGLSCSKNMALLHSAALMRFRAIMLRTSEEAHFLEQR